MLSATIGFALGGPMVAQAALDDIVLVKGINTDRQTMSMSFGEHGFSGDPAQLCRNIRDYMDANGWLGPGGYGGPGAELLNMIFPIGDMGVVPSELGLAALNDCGETRPTRDNYSILFTSCSMHMLSEGTLLTWVVPPGAPQAMMIIADAQTMQVIDGGRVMLNQTFQAVGTAAQGRATEQQSVSPTSRTGEWDIIVGETNGDGGYLSVGQETYTANIFNFDYKGTISIPGMEALGMSMGELESDGVAHIVPNLPGSDVIGEFYKNFRDEVLPSMQANSLMAQTFKQMADIASNGVPVHTSQTIKMENGMLSMFGGSAGAGSTSTNTIKQVTVWRGGAAQSEFCGHSVVPEGWTSTSMDEMMADAMGGAGGAGAAPGLTPEQQAQMNEGMQQLNDALEGMSDEDRAALQGLGLGNIIPGLGNQEPAADPAGQPAAASRSASRSADLMTDNLLQSVQLHLEALGIAPGNTSGEMDLNTQIAISQFQASKGMNPNGEVSPQLLGVLAAEVDK